ncbi:MAG: hypothetical protein ACO1RX_19370 [Candidatus Sericytochromatia bacterium]
MPNLRPAAGSTGPLRPTPSTASGPPASPGFQPAAASFPGVSPLIQRPIQDNVRVSPSGSAALNMPMLDISTRPEGWAQMSASFSVQDVDGLDQKSKGDLRGQLDVDLQLSRELLENSISEANKQSGSIKFELEYDARTQRYSIPITYDGMVDINLGTVSIQPQAGGKLKVEISGLTGGAARLVNAASFGTAKGLADKLIQDLSRDMGFKVKTNSVTSFTLEPDLANSPLFREIPLMGGERIKLESVTPGNGSLMDIKADNQGNLRLQMQDLSVVASSAASGPAAVADREGADRLSLQAEATLNPDMSADVQTELDVELNVQQSEKAGLQSRLRGLTGQDIPLSGRASISDLRVNAHVLPNGQVTQVNTESGTVRAENLDLTLPGNTQVQLRQVEGQVGVERAQTVTRVTANNVKMSGAIASPQGNLTLGQLNFSGALVQDSRTPNTIRIEQNPGSPLTLTGSASQGSQRVDVRNLSLSNAQLEANLTSGSLSLQAHNGKTPDLSVAQLSLPGTTVRNLRVQGGLTANPQSGNLDINARSFSLRATSGDLNLTQLSGSGKAQLNAQGLSLTDASFDVRGTAGEVGITRLKGRGSLQVGSNGNVDITSVRGLDLRTNNGLSLKGDFSGSLHGQQLDLRTRGSTTATMDFTAPDGSMRLEGLSVKGAQINGNLASGSIQLAPAPGQQLDARAQALIFPGAELRNVSLQGTLSTTPLTGEVTIDAQRFALDAKFGEVTLDDLEGQGHVKVNAQRQTVHFAGLPGQDLQMKQGNLAGVSVKDVRMNGTLDFNPNALVASPLEGQPLRLAGQLDQVKIGSLESDGPVSYDLRRQEIRWEQPTRASLPDHGITDIRTEGPMSVQTRANGEIVFSSDDGTLNARLGALHLENLKTNGKVIYQPSSGEIRFEGLDGQQLQVEGNFNGHPLNLQSSGRIQIDNSAEGYRISGEGIQLKGLVDGFVLESPEGMNGVVSMKRDFSGFELQDLNFGFRVDDIAVTEGQGQVRSTPEGLEVTLNGSLGTNKEQLQSLFGKLAARPEYGAQFTQGMNQVQQALDQGFADFKNASLNFENLKLELNPDMSLRRFSVDNNSRIHNARMDMEINGRKRELPMGDVTWTAQVEGTPGQVNIPEGHVSFSLTPELRRTLADEVEKQLEDSGLKKVELEIEPNGKVKILNATVNGQPINVSASLELSTRIVDNRLEVSLDKLKLKNFLLDLVGKVINAPDKVADQVDAMMTQQGIAYERRNRRGTPDPEGGRVFSLDLQALLRRIDPGITLTNASLDEQGRINADYQYRRSLN